MRQKHTQTHILNISFNTLNAFIWDSYIDELSNFFFWWLLIMFSHKIPERIQCYLRRFLHFLQMEEREINVLFSLQKLSTVFVSFFQCVSKSIYHINKCLWIIEQFCHLHCVQKITATKDFTRRKSNNQINCLQSGFPKNCRSTKTVVYSVRIRFKESTLLLFFVQNWVSYNYIKMKIMNWWIKMMHWIKWTSPFDDDYYNRTVVESYLVQWAGLNVEYSLSLVRELIEKLFTKQ